MHETIELESVVLEIRQQPSMAWFPVFALLFVGCVVGIGAWQGFGFVAVAAWLGMLASMITSRVFRPKARIEVGPGRVVVSGWLGRLPWPTRRVLPLEGTRVEARPSRRLRLQGEQLVTLALIGPDATVILPALEIAAGDAARVERRLEDLRTFSRALRGDGPVAEPEALRDLRRRLLE